MHVLALGPCQLICQQTLPSVLREQECPMSTWASFLESEVKIATVHYEFTTEILTLSPLNSSVKLCYYAPFKDEVYRR